MSPSTFAHELGLVGELLNLAGAFILARELLNRDKNDLTEGQLRELQEFAKKHGSPATYKNIAAASGHFVRRIMNQGIRRQAKVGIFLLLLGFILLAGYHVLEIIESARCNG